jgi:hypothetical protein
MKATPTHGTGIDPELLEPFDAYRALLEVVGCVGTAPAAPVQVNVSVHRWALETALHKHLDLHAPSWPMPMTLATPRSTGGRSATRG